MNQSRSTSLYVQQTAYFEARFLTWSQKVQALACPFQNYPDIFPCRDATYLRFSNIRDAMAVLSHTGSMPIGWRIDAISAQEINKVSPVVLSQVNCMVTLDIRALEYPFLLPRMRDCTTSLFIPLLV